MPKSAAAVPEVQVRLEVNGRSVAGWTCSPADYDALAAGRLLADGWIRSASDLESIDVAAPATGPVVLRVRIGEAAAERRRAGAGEPLPGREAGRLALPPVAELTRLMRPLFDGPSGVHTAALTDGDTLVARVEEVGRHNAVDKAIGRALLDERDLARLGLMLTARVSGEIAGKAARAGLAWIASRSVPTTLALEIAGTARMPIVARALGREPHIYVPPEPRAVP